MARTKSDSPFTKQVSGYVTPGAAKALDELHWTLRKPTGELVREAVTDYLAKHKVKVVEPQAPAVTESAEADDKA